MALHRYLEETVGSKASIRVFRTLVGFRGKVFTIRELARTAGLSHPEVSKVVRDLERRGVVRLQPVGKAKQVLLNEESYILKSVVEPMIKAEENTLSSLVSTIRPFFKEKGITSVALFGSVAKGLEKTISDVDLLVIAEDRELANECVAKAGATMIPKFGVGLSPLIMSAAQFTRKEGRGLARSILESYTLVCGRDLREIVEGGKISR
jgi:predicted DNA-binding transcriptional regulator